MWIILSFLNMLENFIHAYKIVKFIKNKDKHILIIDSNFIAVKKLKTDDTILSIDILPNNRRPRVIRTEFRENEDVVDGLADEGVMR